MDLSNLEFFGVAITSGIVAGVANQVARFGHDWMARKGARDQQARELGHQEALQARELQHQRDLQREERDHQAEIRQEAAFFDARKELLRHAVDTHAWIQWAWGKDFGAEVDYYPISIHKPKFSEPADAITALTEIAGSHPSKNLRAYARALADSIDGVVNMPMPDGSADPGVEDYSNWSQRAEQLIDAMHDPTYSPQEIRGLPHSGA